MERNIMIAGSCPTIITSGGNPRPSRDFDNIFLRKYVSLFGELLKAKGNSKDIKIVYIGGSSKEKNIDRAKLYINAYNGFLEALGYEKLSKNNVMVVEEDNIDENLENIEQCDVLFLGVGTDSKFASTISALEEKGMKLNELIRNKNILVSSICSGSVMSSERIYGGVYDNFYYGKEVYEYPYHLKALNFNPVTMETNYCPNDATKEQNETFIENYLKPDSNKCVFFACKPNSLFLIGEDKIYSYGEMYLFIDGECLQIESELDVSDVTELVALVNEYNKVKNKSNILNNEMVTVIKCKVQSLVKMKIETDLKLEEENIVNEFVQKETVKNEQNKIRVNEWKQALKSKLNYLFSEENLGNFIADLNYQERYKRLNENIIDSYNVDRSKDYLEELYLKINLVSLIKVSYIDYLGFYSDFKGDLYDLLCEYISDNDTLVYYVIDTLGCLFTNQELKQIINRISIENKKRPQQMINTTKEKLKLFRKERKYERS